ncbi:glycosyltransferase family 2 protein [Sphingomonas bacterium]|uniref:glycosyltransferase family 2 protein n=1 Tax=Sphingomonas bacterium TaxID=1895847 RepID=UPI00260DE05A|nr:glycosyltransferase [Sphingomonas bacterium]MDB5679932.1 glycosyl transferase, family 2 [Sphingomonas bacterium]
MLQRTAADALAQTFAILSPRLNPRRVHFASRAITSLVYTALVALVAMAFLRQGILVWSVGVAYILYDTALLIFTAIEIWPLRHGTRVQVTDAPQPSLAVIVAARNEAAVLDVTIDRLAHQDGAPDLILIADDGSDDATAATLARYGLEQPEVGAISGPARDLPSLRWLRLPHGGKARALNAAILHVDEEIVITVDADTLLEPGAIAAMRAAFAAEPELVAATGVIRPMCGPSLSGRLFEWFQTYEYVRNFLSRHAWEQLNGLLLVSGAFAAFRTKAVVEVGGFDPDCLVEDYELIHRLHRFAHDSGRDWRVRVIGGALASTDAPATLPAFLRQRRRWFGGFLQTQHWNRDMVGNGRFGKLGTAMLPVKAADTVQPIFGLAAFVILLVVLFSGRFHIVLPILIIMGVKIAIDLTFHLASLSLYSRWTGQTKGLRLGPALAAALLEPFSFQLFRHWGAILGWKAFLTGRETWARQSRTAIAEVKREG